MTRSIASLAGICLLLAGSGCGPADSPGSPGNAGAAQNKAPRSLKTAPVRRGEIFRSIVLPAEIKPYQEATLYAKVGGYLKTIAVDKGDSVRAGDVLATLEIPELVADRAKFEAELELARLELRRLTDAQAKAPDLVTLQSVDVARAKADVAKAALDRLSTLLGYGRIVAPFAGVVTKRMADPGAFIPAATSGTPTQTPAVLTLMDFTKVRVQVPVPERDVPHIRDGTPVQVMVEGTAKPLAASVTRFSHALDPNTQTMLAEIEIANPKEELRPGMYAKVKLFVEKKENVLLIPEAAVDAEKSGTFAFLLNGQKARKVPIKPGFRDGTSAEIVQPELGPAEQVILFGNQPLNDGDPVTVQAGP